MKLYSKILILSLLACVLISCADEFVDTEPTENIPGEQLIVDQASAQSALYGTYSGMQLARVFGGYDVFFTGMYADDFQHRGSFPSFADVNANDPQINNVDLQNYWDEHYSVIYRANNVINTVPTLDFDQTEKSRIIGEAKAIRALIYYYLVKVYGGVPIVMEAYSAPSDIDLNPVARSSVSEVYSFILEDAKYAVDNLGGGNYYSFNKNSARVLKAKIEMELGLYSAARSTIEPLIGTYMLAPTVEDLYTSGSANSQESILALDFSDVDGGNHAFFFYGSSAGGRGEVGPSASLLDAFEENDDRASLFVDTNIGGGISINKYRDPGTGADDVYIFRYADVLLMYAELLAREGDVTASDYINQVRTRADLEPVALTSSNFVDLIAQERRVEFFAEMSDRLFTITRLGIANDIIEAKPNNVFIEERNNLWPIPQQEIERNSLINVEDQNAGY